VKGNVTEREKSPTVVCKVEMDKNQEGGSKGASITKEGATFFTNNKKSLGKNEKMSFFWEGINRKRDATRGSPGLGWEETEEIKEKKG